MKAFTDLEQSKKLVSILPPESADMFYNEEPDETYTKDIVDTKYPMVIRGEQKHYLEEYGIPCWSLAALIELMGECRMERTPLDQTGEFTHSFVDDYFNIRTYEEYELVDAAVEMIYKLKEKDLL